MASEPTLTTSCHLNRLFRVPVPNTVSLKGPRVGAPNMNWGGGCNSAYERHLSTWHINHLQVPRHCNVSRPSLASLSGPTLCLWALPGSGTHLVSTSQGQSISNTPVESAHFPPSPLQQTWSKPPFSLIRTALWPPNWPLLLGYAHFHSWYGSARKVS
jgi:hypothetical protein